MRVEAPTLVVLAAGASRRFGRPKQLEPLGPQGETLIDYALFDAARAGFGRAVIVTRPDLWPALSEHLRRGEPPLPFDWVEQDVSDLPESSRTRFPAWPVALQNRGRPWGTAHAVWVARGAVPGPFAVVNGDDFYGATAYRTAFDFLRRVDPTHAHFAIMGYQLDRTLSPTGGVSRAVCEMGGDGTLRTVNEVLNLRAVTKGVRGTDPEGRTVYLGGNETVSMNLWGFTPLVFAAIEAALTAFLDGRGDEGDAELHLPAVVNELVRHNAATVDVLPAGSETFGVTFDADRRAVSARLAELVAAGEYPTPQGQGPTCS